MIPFVACFVVLVTDALHSLLVRQYLRLPWAGFFLPCNPTLLKVDFLSVEFARLRCYGRVEFSRLLIFSGLRFSSFECGQAIRSSNALIRLCVEAHSESMSLSNTSSRFVLLRVSYLSMQSNPVPNQCSYQPTNFPKPLLFPSYCCASPLLFRFFFSFFGTGPFNSAWNVS